MRKCDESRKSHETRTRFVDWRVFMMIEYKLNKPNVFIRRLFVTHREDRTESIERSSESVGQTKIHVDQSEFRRNRCAKTNDGMCGKKNAPKVSRTKMSHMSSPAKQSAVAECTGASNGKQWLCTDKQERESRVPKKRRSRRRRCGRCRWIERPETEVAALNPPPTARNRSEQSKKTWKGVASRAVSAARSGRCLGRFVRGRCNGRQNLGKNQRIGKRCASDLDLKTIDKFDGTIRMTDWQLWWSSQVPPLENVDLAINDWVDMRLMKCFATFWNKL